MRKTKTEYKIRLLGLYAISTHNLIFSVILQWWWWIEPENVGAYILGCSRQNSPPYLLECCCPLLWPLLSDTSRHLTFHSLFDLLCSTICIVLSTFQILFSANIFITKTKLVEYVWGEKNYIDITAKAYLFHLYYIFEVKNLFEFVSRIV